MKPGMYSQEQAERYFDISMAGLMSVGRTKEGRFIRYDLERAYGDFRRACYILIAKKYKKDVNEIRGAYGYGEAMRAKHEILNTPEVAALCASIEEEIKADRIDQSIIFHKGAYIEPQLAESYLNAMKNIMIEIGKEIGK